MFSELKLDKFIRLLQYELFVAVSYNRKKLRLKWGAGGVTVNSELKLLQYNIGKPVVLEETIDYMLEKNGKNFIFM